MKSILIVCLIGLAACQSPSPEPEPTTNAGTPAVADVVAAPAETTVKTPETKPAQKPEQTSPPRKGCNPLCKTPLETCVRLANCVGNECFKCAITASIVLPGTKVDTAKPVTLPANLPSAFQSIVAGQPNALQKTALLQQVAAAQAAADQAQAAQSAQQQSGFGGLFGNTADPLNNMLFGSMLMDGGMGFGF